MALPKMVKDGTGANGFVSVELAGTALSTCVNFVTSIKFSCIFLGTYVNFGTSE
jgi:hypothetical protein